MTGVPDRRLEISVTASAPGVAVEIADTGSGLHATVRKRLFEPFVSTKSDGMGVGLSLCRTIIEAHGGMISAEDRAGGGTIFRFTLPPAN